MRSILILGVVVGTVASLFIIGHAMKLLVMEHGLIVGALGLGAMFCLFMCLAMLVDRRRAGAVALLEKIERRYGLDLTAEKEEARNT